MKNKKQTPASPAGAGPRSAKPSPRRRVLIVDDHPIMRQGLVALINNEPDLMVCCEAETTGEALTMLEQRHPEILVTDLSLPDRSGLELIKDVAARFPGIPVLALSMHDEAIYAERVLRAGGRGYVMKQEGGRKLLDAIRAVLGGKTHVSERMSARIVELFAGRRPAHESPVSALSDREFEVFQLIGRGRGTREIAAQMRLSIKTVEAHRLHIKEKLGLASAAALTRHAVRWVESQNPA
jgi:DNA-binding NarL/FixJ family response regulator